MFNVWLERAFSVLYCSCKVCYNIGIDTLSACRVQLLYALAGHWNYRNLCHINHNVLDICLYACLRGVSMHVDPLRFCNKWSIETWKTQETSFAGRHKSKMQNLQHALRHMGQPYLLLMCLQRQSDSFHSISGNNIESTIYYSFV